MAFSPVDNDTVFNKKSTKNVMLISALIQYNCGNAESI